MSDVDEVFLDLSPLSVHIPSSDPQKIVRWVDLAVDYGRDINLEGMWGGGLIKTRLSPGDEYYDPTNQPSYVELSGDPLQTLLLKVCWNDIEGVELWAARGSPFFAAATLMDGEWGSTRSTLAIDSAYIASVPTRRDVAESLIFLCTLASYLGSLSFGAIISLPDCAGMRDGETSEMKSDTISSKSPLAACWGWLLAEHARDEEKRAAIWASENRCSNCGVPMKKWAWFCERGHCSDLAPDQSIAEHRRERLNFIPVDAETKYDQLTIYVCGDCGAECDRNRPLCPECSSRNRLVSAWTESACLVCGIGWESDWRHPLHEDEVNGTYLRLDSISELRGLLATDLIIDFDPMEDHDEHTVYYCSRCGGVSRPFDSGSCQSCGSAVRMSRWDRETRCSVCGIGWNYDDRHTSHRGNDLVHMYTRVSSRWRNSSSYDSHQSPYADDPIYDRHHTPWGQEGREFRWEIDHECVHGIRIQQCGNCY
jgi:hypothetical protein